MGCARDVLVVIGFVLMFPVLIWISTTETKKERKSVHAAVYCIVFFHTSWMNAIMQRATISSPRDSAGG